MKLSVRSLLINKEEQRFRALFRMILQLVMMALVAGLPVAGLGAAADRLLKSGALPLSPEIFDKAMDMIVGVILTALVLLSLALGARWIDRRDFRSFGFHLGPRWWKQYALGFSLGAVLISLLVAVELAAGWLEVTEAFPSPPNAIPFWMAFLYPVVKASCVGVYEEAIGRGWLILNLKEGFSGSPGKGEARALGAALLLSSAVFGALHMLNPNATLLSTVSLMFNGMFLATAFIATGELGMSIGLHMAWNLSQGFVFGLPVSGDAEIASILRMQQGGPDVLTGAAFGPEGGLLGLACSIVGIAALLLIRERVPALFDGGKASRG